MQDFRELLVRCRPQHFTSILIGPKWHLSVQASEFHYSSPRQTLSADQYSAWEIAVLQDGELAPPPSGCPWANNWEEGSSPVAGFVPTEKVQQIYEWLKRNFGSPIEQLAIAKEDAEKEHEA